MKVHVDINYMKVKKITNAQIVSAKKTAAHLRKLIINEQVIPFRTGHLQNDMTDVDLTEAKQGKVAITHDGPYAARMYYNPQYHFHKEFNPNARGMWWEAYLTGDKKKVPFKLYKAYFKKESGV